MKQKKENMILKESRKKKMQKKGRERENKKDISTYSKKCTEKEFVEMITFYS